MLKKFVTLLTILALSISAILPVQLFAAADISYEGRICRDLGILKGDTGVVDSAYLGTRPSRLQAAIMFLRLKGLEQRALSYTGGNNFKDAGGIAWKEGRNVLSYLKDHPELGWIGDGINFLPYNLIDSKAYYKVLLESLGYKQKIDGDGDFDWSEVLDFAEEKGLKKVAGVKNFTVESLAIATVEALKTKMKGSGKKLIEYLVEIGDVDEDDAIDLDLYSREIEASVKTVRAISNSKVEVVFEKSVYGSEAADEDLYEIKQLDIKNVSMKNDSAVIIDTSAMNDSSTYTLVFDDRSYSFKGLKKDSYAPKLISAECKDTDLVELTFDRVLDNITAQDTNIYSIEDAEVKSAELDSTNTKVRLTTSGIQSGRSYELKIKGIKNGDGVTTKSITKRFPGRKDTSAPKLNKLTVLNNIKLQLEFSDSNGLDKATAQDEDNYRITSSEGGLEVESVTVKDRDDDGMLDTVELVTESQHTGSQYTFIIEDLKDGSVLGNRITREIKKEFRGKSVDKTGPTIARNPKAVTNTMVEIEFADSNALDLESACDVDSYETDDDLDILEARIKDTKDLYSAKGRTVLLITSEMEKSETYTLRITGITDEFGNEMKSSGSERNYRFKGIAEDRIPPYITFVECIDSKTIELNFDNTLDEESAETLTNYRVDGLALATKAVLKEDGKTVRLTVSSLSSDKNHTVLLNNIKDLSGNAISNVSVSILYNGNLYDDDPPEVSDIDAVNEKEVWIHFDEEIYAEKAKMKASGISFEQAGSVLDDGTTIVMKASSPMDDEEYEVTSLTGVWDLRNNYYELESGLEFYGTDNENDPPEVDDWNQMDVRRFRVVFSEPVLLIQGEEVSGIKNPNGVSLDWTAVLNPDEEDSNEAYSTVDYIVSNKNIPADREFKFNFTAMVSDYVGLGAYDEDDEDAGDSGSTILESYMEDDQEPYIEYVEAVTRNKAQVVFDEEIREPGRYKITYEDDNNRLRTIDIDLVEVDSKDRTRVNLYTEDEMSDDYYYILEPTSPAVDIAGNRLDIDGLEIEFEGSNIMSSDYMQGVELLNANTLRVSKSSNIYKVSSLYELSEGGSTLGGNLIDSTSRVSDNVHKVISKKPLLKDVRYEIKVDGLFYKFYGGVVSGDIRLELPEREITYAGIDTDKHELEAYRANGDELDIDTERDHFEVDQSEVLKNGELLYLYVVRKSDGVIIYGARIKVEGMQTASSSKEITSFSFKGLDPDAVGSIDNDSNVIRLYVPYGTDPDSLAATFVCSEYAVVKVGSEIQQSGITENDFSEEVTYTVIAQDGSKRTYKVKVTIEDSIYEKKITSFVFEEFKPYVVGQIDKEKHMIKLTLPNGTSLEALKPTIETSPDTILYPASGKVMDFSEPVIYTVKAKDGSVQNYTVQANVNMSSDNFITAFEFDGVDALEKVITAGDKNTINIKVPYGTKVTELTPIITISEYAAITPLSGVKNDFSGGLIYTVTAQDGSKRDYTVYVSRAASSAKSIKSFSLMGFDPAVEASVGEKQKTIELTVPYGTERTKLKAVYTVSPEAVVKVGDNVQISGETENDFFDTVKYTVVAEDGSSRSYNVKVSIAPNSEKLMKEFGFAAPGAIGLIDEASKSITVKVPYGTLINELKAVFSSSDNSKVFVGADEQKSGETIKDFTNPVEYNVVAQDGSMQNYKVTVAVAAENEKYITGFVFNGLNPAVKGVIDQSDRTIMLKVPAETDVISLVPTFSFIGKYVHVGDTQQISGKTANDFSGNVVYTITAFDDTTQEYTVIVNK